MKTSAFMSRLQLEAAVGAFDTSPEERKRLFDALRAVPSSAGVRMAFVLPLDRIAATYSEEISSGFRSFADTLPPLGSPFSWIPLHDFVLLYGRLGNLVYPDLPIHEAIGQLIVDQVPTLKQIPTVQTLIAAADNDLCTFFLQGSQSTSLSLSFSVNDVGEHDQNSIVMHCGDAYYPALMYIQYGYFAGIFAYFGVEGRQTYFDLYPTGCSIRLEW